MTIMKARKKPVEIEFIQFTDIESAEDIEKWSGNEAYYFVENHIPMMRIKTLEGDMIANVGDYIIKGVNGEFYPCKADVFNKTYEVLGND